MMNNNLTRDRLTTVLTERIPGIDPVYAHELSKDLLDTLDPRLMPNLEEWVEGRPVSNIWIGQYCVNAILSLWKSRDFLSALIALNEYAKDEKKGIQKIWRGKK